MDWDLAEAENKLDELVTRAVTEGPQTIHRDGTTVVVVAEKTFLAMTHPTRDFNDWLLNGPRLDDLELPDRSRFAMRPVDL